MSTLYDTNDKKVLRTLGRFLGIWCRKGPLHNTSRKACEMIRDPEVQLLTIDRTDWGNSQAPHYARSMSQYYGSKVSLITNADCRFVDTSQSCHAGVMTRVGHMVLPSTMMYRRSRRRGDSSYTKKVSNLLFFFLNFWQGAAFLCFYPNKLQ